MLTLANNTNNYPDVASVVLTGVAIVFGMLVGLIISLWIGFIYSISFCAFCAFLTRQLADGGKNDADWTNRLRSCTQYCERGENTKVQKNTILNKISSLIYTKNNGYVRFSYKRNRFSF
mgnify:CR=1 FL=1